MQDTVIQAFQGKFGSTPTYLTRAPGRVNLIGEHTDYNDGFVLPMAIDRHIWVAAALRNDRTLAVHSVDFGADVSFSLEHLQDQSLPHWTHHLRGVWYLLKERGISLPGANILIAGDVPIGAGLSSSAAIEVALIELALAINHTAWPQHEKALFGVEVEHKFSGMPSGVMDQMASAVSQAGHALLIDCRSLETSRVHLPDHIAVVVMDTATRRQLVASAYAERRQQCEEAAKILGVSALRDADLKTVKAQQQELGDVRFRRARHIVSENERVLLFIQALQSHDLSKAGELMNQSHVSLRDDYEVSREELDIISDIARQQSGCYGARMTGAGFGGCAVAFVQFDAVEDFIPAVIADYETRTNLHPELYVFQPAGGSTVVQRPE
jgi:galactokinase